MSVHAVYIIDAADDRPVQVELDDELSIDSLLDIEDQWASVREDIRAKLRKLGVGTRPESLHWNWSEKSLRLAFCDSDDFRVFAIRRKNAYEGAMVTRSKNHFAELPPDAGKPLVYVDYLEVAPWNWKVENIQARQFKAVGPVLLQAAIEQSYAKGWKGRIGLHSLPQAMGFYADHGLERVRNEPSKQNLPYYELSAAEAAKRRGLK